MNKINPAITMAGKRLGFVYLLACANHYKIGHSNNVDGVLASAHRFDKGTRLLTSWILVDPEEVEGWLHESLKAYRIEGEQFNLPTETVRWLASLDDREFGMWVSETQCDARSIGWTFPRVYYRGEKRTWAAMYIPESDCVSWAAVAHETKPEYSELEKMWMMDSRAFKSSWLTNPWQRAMRFRTSPPDHQAKPEPHQPTNP